MKIRDLRSFPRSGAIKFFVVEIDAVGELALHRNTNCVNARMLRAIRSRGAERIVNADNRGAAARHAHDKALFHLGVVLDAAVTVDVILGDIEQDTNARMQRGRQVDLIRRHFDHMDAVRRWRLQRQDRSADIAAHLGIESGLAHQMRDQRRGSGFAVGAGDGDERRARRGAQPLAAEQFDVADHLDPGGLCLLDSPVRLGMRSAARRASAPARRNRPTTPRADRR